MVAANAPEIEAELAAAEPTISTGEPYYRQPGLSLRDRRSRPHIGAMHLDLTDDETAALTQELHDIVESDKYPFSARIRTLRAILAKLRPEPARDLPPAATEGNRRQKKRRTVIVRTST